MFFLSLCKKITFPPLAAVQLPAERGDDHWIRLGHYWCQRPNKTSVLCIRFTTGLRKKEHKMRLHMQTLMFQTGNEKRRHSSTQTRNEKLSKTSEVSSCYFSLPASAMVTKIVVLVQRMYRLWCNLSRISSEVRNSKKCTTSWITSNIIFELSRY